MDIHTSIHPSMRGPSTYKAGFFLFSSISSIPSFFYSKESDESGQPIVVVPTVQQGREYRGKTRRNRRSRRVEGAIFFLFRLSISKCMSKVVQLHKYERSGRPYSGCQLSFLLLPLLPSTPLVCLSVHRSSCLSLCACSYFKP